LMIPDVAVELKMKQTRKEEWMEMFSERERERVAEMEEKGRRKDEFIRGILEQKKESLAWKKEEMTEMLKVKQERVEDNKRWMLDMAHGALSDARSKCEENRHKVMEESNRLNQEREARLVTEMEKKVERFGP
jgi:hypothetical protein